MSRSKFLGTPSIMQGQVVSSLNHNPWSKLSHTDENGRRGRWMRRERCSSGPMERRPTPRVVIVESVADLMKSSRMRRTGEALRRYVGERLREVRVALTGGVREGARRGTDGTRARLLGAGCTAAEKAAVNAGRTDAGTTRGARARGERSRDATQGETGRGQPRQSTRPRRRR